MRCSKASAGWKPPVSMCSGQRITGSASRSLFDPNGIRLEMTLRTEAPGELNRMECAAGERLAAWNVRKQRKYGAAAAVQEAV